MRLINYLLLLCLLTVAGGTFAAAPVLNRDYRLVVPPQPTETGDKIEVIEFFYYGCPHCFALEPYLKKWLSSAPKDVAYRRIPAVFNESWVPLTKAFYALEALGELNRLNDGLYEAIHVSHQIDLRNQQSLEQSLFDWVAKQGIDRKKFADVYNSFSVNTRVAFASNLTRAYGIEGTPALVVAGKYLTAPSMTGSNESVIPVLNQLIDQARQERSSKR
ncbi:MAG TPA: thiol:disulfide interchange protein DsbA/DsbL [Burkholderiales bacterium]|nr:thiol:disulfide interchange protein DsbA/DsbL [Burkholderiales bacterium]